MSRIMGIDYGEVRVGIALTDPLKIISSGYKTLKNSKTIFTETYSVPSIVCPQGVKYIYLDLVLQYTSESTNTNYTQNGVYPLVLECIYRFNA